MPDPLSRLQMARDEINKSFGPNFAEQHPKLVVVVSLPSATGRQHVSPSPSSVWPRRSWSRRRRSTLCRRVSFFVHVRD
jgi:hypothetical protein